MSLKHKRSNNATIFFSNFTIKKSAIEKSYSEVRETSEITFMIFALFSLYYYRPNVHSRHCLKYRLRI